MISFRSARQLPDADAARDPIEVALQLIGVLGGAEAKMTMLAHSSAEPDVLHRVKEAAQQRFTQRVLQLREPILEVKLLHRDRESQQAEDEGRCL